LPFGDSAAIHPREVLAVYLTKEWFTEWCLDRPEIRQERLLFKKIINKKTAPSFDGAILTR